MNASPLDQPVAPIDLSVVIPALRESKNLKFLLPDLAQSLEALNIRWEVLVIDGDSNDGTVDIVRHEHMRCVVEYSPGYGAALKRGFRESRGRFVLTMDADLSHPTTFIETIWETRETAALVIASRYVSGGGARQNPFRSLLSRILNQFFRVGFGLPYNDLSSGFRLYHAEVIRALDLTYLNFVVLIEIVLKLKHDNHAIVEVPFLYEPRYSGASKARIIRFGKDYLRLFVRMQKLRRMK